MRTVGVEEELLVVDPETGRPLSVAGRVLGLAAERPVTAEHRNARGPGGSLGGELQRQQVETDTPPRTDLAELERDVLAWREVAVVAARRAGARVVAAGTSPLPASAQPQRDPRYEQIMERFGTTSAEQLSCGCHVHVAVEDDEEAVGVLDRIRVWLPVLLALSANSPFWNGEDTAYDSFRSQVIARWPSAGPPDVFGSAAAYHRRIAAMVDSGVLLDAGMVYLDARLSADYPTLEVRVADVCQDPRTTVLVAALCRGLVDTAAEEWRQGRPAPDVPAAMLRLADWQAAREGLDGALLDPISCRPRPAADVVADLLRYVAPALAANGDDALVEERVARLLEEGNGAHRQRAVLEKTGRMVDVVADLARVTAGMDPS